MTREASARLEEIASTSVALKSRAGRRHDQLRYHREIETTTPRTSDVGARGGRGCGSDALVFDLVKDLMNNIHHKTENKRYL